jgi:hypothetical protein
MNVLFNRRNIIYNTNIRKQYSDWMQAYQVKYRKNKETRYTYHKNLNIVSKKFEIDHDSLYHAFPNKREPVYYILDMQTKNSNFFVVNIKTSKAQFWDGFINLKTNQIAYYETQEFYDYDHCRYEEEVLVTEDVDYIFKATPYKDVNGNVIFENDIIINYIDANYIDAYFVKATDEGYIVESYNDSEYYYSLEEWLNHKFYRCITIDSLDIYR